MPGSTAGTMCSSMTIFGACAPAMPAKPTRKAAAMLFISPPPSECLSCAAHGKAVDAQRRLPDADRDALSFLAARADARIERQIVADHGHARERIRTVADQRRAFHRVRHLAVLDQVGLRGREDELAVGDVDLAAAEVGGVKALLHAADDLL